MKRILAVAMFLALVCVLSSFAFAEQSAAAAQQTAGTPAPAPVGVDYKAIFKALGAALAIGFSAFGTAWAQSKIGSAAAGAIAEKPEISGSMIILEALPETIIILGFVIALLIIVLI
jgi:V/A-type H+-transporting ATPase subunit K